MKKIIMSLVALTLFGAGSIVFTACGGETAKSADQEQNVDGGEEASADVYQCPMKCEGDKTYAEAGKCPVCKMDTEVMAAHDHDDHGHDHGEEGHDHDEHGHDHGDDQEGHDDGDDHDHSEEEATEVAE